VVLDQMLRKRQLSVMRKKVAMADSSFQELEADMAGISEHASELRTRASIAAGTSKGKVKSSGVFRVVEDFNASSDSPTSPTDSKDELDHLKGAESINTFLKERILYHGPVPYMQEYVAV